MDLCQLGDTMHKEDCENTSSNKQFPVAGQATEATV